MDVNIHKKMWHYFQNNPTKKDSFFKLINAIESSGYCFDPFCKCSRSTLWIERIQSQEENDYDDLPNNILDELIKAFNQSTKNDYQSKYQIECPICRTINLITADQKNIYGSSDICSICLENICQIFLPQCGHICLCLICSEKLRSNLN